MATARLPGIYFESVPLPPPALLPRMDIAAFAGFLPSGPIGVPFLLEDRDRFQDVFGTDQPLAWDPDLQQMRLAQTAPAVRTFFRNGGQRCWVLRLANNAQSNTWTIPGLLQVDQAGFHAGGVRARCEGSWSDDLTVNATLMETPLPPQLLGWPGTGSSPQPVNGWLDPGDVAQVFYPTSQTLAYYDVSTLQWYWFQAAFPNPGSPPLGQPDSVSFLSAGGNTAIAFSSFTSDSAGLALGMSRELALTVPPGSWLQMKFGERTLLLQVQAMDAGSGTSGSPPASEAATLTSSLAWWWLPDQAGAWAANQGNSFQASVVTFELWAWPQGEPVQQLSGLGFSPDNPLYWGWLPTDAELYTPVTRPAPLPYAALAAEIDNPRFPLAGPASLGLGLPLGMAALVQSSFTQAPTPQTLTALERDGLSSFDPTLFIDSALADSGSATLLQDAFYVQYQAQNPRSLSGMHALLAVDEISMVAVPDAIHSGWQRSPLQTASLAPPDPVQVSTPNEGGAYLVSWSSVPQAIGYTLDQSSDPTFQTAVTSQDVGAALSQSFSSSPQCPSELYYRVAAYGLPGDGPWSQTVPVLLGSGDFSPCNPQLLSAPQLTLQPEGNRLLLAWTPAPGVAPSSYALQIGQDPQFESAETLYQGDDTGFQYWTTPGAPAYLRVSAQFAGQSSPWSNTVQTPAQPVSPWQVVPFAPPSPPAQFTVPPVLMSVQTALLIMAAARGDQVAILSLPDSFRKSDALSYKSLLLQAALDDSPRTPSYGALYHPWIITPDNTNPPPGSLRTMVPDGAVCGAIASTTLASGAWIAPANVAVSNAVDLAPMLESDTPLAFAASQINLIAQRPEGFLIMSQDTLMPDDDPLQPLNVRRLMIVLRRLALREGVRYVFQSMTAAFQRAITRQFQQWMQFMLARGAFAGVSAQDSYQVITDATVNSPDSMDQGRFIVELRVAPSLPMQFLTVKLVQSGGQLTLLEA